MFRVSTNLTLFFKFFIPIFWIVFFGAFTIVSWFAPGQYFGELAGLPFRIGTAIFFITGVLLLYFTLLPLKRVELDEDYLYVTNYFKTARYPYHNVKKMVSSDFLFIKLVSIHLKAGGIFGKRMRFLASKHRFNSFFEKYPHLAAQILTAEE